MTTTPTPTPLGVENDHAAFACPVGCDKGLSRTEGASRFLLVCCECHRDEGAPDGYVSETLCDCDAVLTPETTRGLDGPTHPLCGDCLAAWTEGDSMTKDNEIRRPMSHDDEPVTVSGLLGLLIAKADSAGELARTPIDGGIFRELAFEARLIEKAILTERTQTLEMTLEGLKRISDSIAGSR